MRGEKSEAGRKGGREGGRGDKHYTPVGSTSLASLRASEVARSLLAGVTASTRQLSLDTNCMSMSLIWNSMSAGWSPTGTLVSPGRSTTVRFSTDRGRREGGREGGREGRREGGEESMKASHGPRMQCDAMKPCGSFNHIRTLALLNTSYIYTIHTSYHQTSLSHSHTHSHKPTLTHSHTSPCGEWTLRLMGTLDMPLFLPVSLSVSTSISLRTSLKSVNFFPFAWRNSAHSTRRDDGWFQLM